MMTAGLGAELRFEFALVSDQTVPFVNVESRVMSLNPTASFTTMRPSLRPRTLIRVSKVTGALAMIAPSGRMGARGVVCACTAAVVSAMAIRGRSISRRAKCDGEATGAETPSSMACRTWQYLRGLHPARFTFQWKEHHGSGGRSATRDFDEPTIPGSRRPWPAS